MSPPSCNQRSTSWLEETQRKTTTDIGSKSEPSVKTNLFPADVSLHMVWHRAQDHTVWSTLMKTAMLHRSVLGHATDDDELAVFSQPK